MPSFDVLSEVNWPEVENARNQALKETQQRFDFKGCTTTIEIEKKDKKITLVSSKDEKINAVVDVFRDKLAKRGIALLSFEFSAPESSLGGGSRVTVKVQAGIDKDKAKTLVKAIKDKGFKAQVQIQDEQLRVTAKKKDELQDVIAFLKEQQAEVKLPLQFGNYRD